jgi:hypothetical protein
MNVLKAIVNLFRFDRTNWRAAFLCLITALVFWLFNALNKKYSTNVKFPVRFEYNQELFSPIENLPHQVNVNVTGTGWELFRDFVGFKLPELTIPLERPTEVKKIVGASLPPMLAPQLGKLQINYIVTDTLKIQLDETDSHRFKLYADLSNVKFENTFGRISPVVILPDSVELTGPKALLHNLPDSILLSIVANRLDQNFEDDVEIKVNSSFVKRNPPLASVIFEVGAVKEIVCAIKLQIKNTSLKGMQPWPDSLNCIFSVPVKRLEEFGRSKKEMLLLVDSKNQTAVPTLLKMPTFVELVKVDSLKVTTNL